MKVGRPLATARDVEEEPNVLLARFERFAAETTVRFFELVVVTLQGVPAMGQLPLSVGSQTTKATFRWRGECKACAGRKLSFN
jgi:hypothetical protein